jgi:PKD repeat protein
VADFAGSPLSGVAPHTVQFTDQSTGATSWSWEFGDGATSTLRNPAHAYQNAGTYTVRLTVTNTGGQNTRSRAGCIVVSAPASPPTAEFTATPLSGSAPLPVQFSDQSTGATSWNWDFGDGVSSSERNPIHIYASGGVFTVLLTVSNSSGQNTRIRQDYISVAALPAAPVAEFTAGPLAGVTPLTVHFADQSTGGPTAWSWDFGDGSFSSQRSPSHTYTTPGRYTVRLTVSNLAGQTTRTRTEYLTVTSASAVDYFCRAMSFEVGKWLGGGPEDTHASDNSYVKTKAIRANGSFSDQVLYLFETGLSSLSSLVVTSESRPKPASVRQQILLFNPSSGEWEQVDDRELTSRSDTTTSVVVSNPSRYLSPSGDVRLRIRTSHLANRKWKHFIDHVKITATP